MAWLRLAVVFLLATAASFYLFLPDPDVRQRASGKTSDRFSNVVLYDQHGRAVRFYDDLVKGRTVVVNLMFVGCGDICPANTAALRTLHELLEPRVGRDITFLSISIDPLADTPERLRLYWKAVGAKPGWKFLTGQPRDIERIRRDLGLYDAAVDTDPAQHTGILTIGNERTNRWSTMPALIPGPELAEAVHRIAGTPSKGDARRGAPLYGTYCASCHGARGGGDGPLAKLFERAPARHTDAAYMGVLADDYLHRLLKEGGPAVGKSPQMSAWGSTLSDGQLEDLIAFMRSLSVDPALPLDTALRPALTQ